MVNSNKRNNDVHSFYEVKITYRDFYIYNIIGLFLRVM